MFSPVRIVCLRSVPPMRIVFGTKGCGDTSSIIGCRPFTMSIRPGATSMLGRTQLLANAMRERLKMQSAVERAAIAARNAS